VKAGSPLDQQLITSQTPITSPALNLDIVVHELLRRRLQLNSLYFA
jgi:hypothetical protein